MTIKDQLESFWAMFEPTSLLAIFQFWSTFWVKWTKMWIDMTIRNHLESFYVTFNLTFIFCHFPSFVNILAEMEQNMDWYDYQEPLRVILCNVQTDFHFLPFCKFRQLFGWNGPKYGLIWLLGTIWSHFRRCSDRLHFWPFTNIGQLFGWNGPKYGLIWLLSDHLESF